MYIRQALAMFHFVLADCLLLTTAGIWELLSKAVQCRAREKPSPRLSPWSGAHVRSLKPLRADPRAALHPTDAPQLQRRYQRSALLGSC